MDMGESGLKKIEKVYLAGLGAIGSVYANIINENCPGVLRVVADKDRISKYKKDGIYLNGKVCEFDFADPKTKGETADLVIISVKFHQLEQAIEDVRNFVGEDTIILSLLNGISSEEIIGAKMGMDKLLYSFSLGIDAVRDGTSVVYTTPGRIVFGEKRNTELSEKVKAVKEFFERAKVTYLIPEDMIRELWFKFMVNIGGNQVSAILQATYGEILESAEASQLMKDAAQEVLDVAGKLGIKLGPADIDEFFRVFATLSKGGKTSMCQDVEAGRKTEVEIFGGELVELGKKAGVATPVNQTLFNIIKSMEQLYLK